MQAYIIRGAVGFVFLPEIFSAYNFKHRSYRW